MHDLLREHRREVLRYALLSAHYRQPLDWSDALIEQCVRTLDRLYGTLRDLGDIDAPAVIPAGVENALDEDLNTPQALAIVNELARDARSALAAGDADRSKLASLKSALLGAGLALGLLQQAPTAWFARGTDAGDDGRINALVDERSAAKKSRDFARADAIRDALAAEGILLEDTAAGVRWRRG